jgi:hypothetical protein
VSDSQKPRPSQAVRESADTAQESGVRGWLKRNKIFFETISASALAAAAIVISVLQLYAVNQQNQIIDLQTRVAEAQVLPSFDMKIVQKKLEQNNAQKSVLQITNSGGPAYELIASIIFPIVISTETIKLPQRKIAIPVIFDDLDLNRVTDLTKGLVFEFDVPWGDERTKKFVSDFSIVVDQIDNYVFLKAFYPPALLQLTYKDVLNRDHTEYFDIDDAFGSQRLDNKGGEAQFLAAQKYLSVKLGSIDAQAIKDDLEKFKCNDEYCHDFVDTL